MKSRFLFPLLTALLFCLSCQNSNQSEIIAGADVVALRGDTYRQGRAVDFDGSMWLVQWLDGDAPGRYKTAELAPLKANNESAAVGSFGLCRNKEGGLWSICRVESVASDRLTVSLLEDSSKIAVSPENFIVPSEGQREYFVKRSAAMLRSGFLQSEKITAKNPPAGMNLPVQPNMVVLLQTSEGEYLRGICGRIDATMLYISPFSAQYVLSTTEDKVAPVSGMGFDRSSYEENLKPGDIIYASPDGVRFLPARVESIMEDGSLIRVLFADSLSMELSEQFWLPQSKETESGTYR